MVQPEDTIDKLGQLHQTVVVHGRKTRVRMEPIMWEALGDICNREKHDRNRLFEVIDRRRGNAGLAAAARVFIINYFRRASEPALAVTGFSEDGLECSQLMMTALEACSDRTV